MQGITLNTQVEVIIRMCLPADVAGCVCVCVPYVDSSGREDAFFGVFHHSAASAVVVVGGVWHTKITHLVTIHSLAHIT